VNLDTRITFGLGGAPARAFGLQPINFNRTIGGLPALIRRNLANFEMLSGWVGRRAWIAFLAADPAIRSATSVCFKLVDPALDPTRQTRLVAEMTKLLEAESAAFDIASYRSAPPGLRIWAGPTVEAADLDALTPWLDWAYEDATKVL